MNAIEVRGLKKSFGSRQVLSNLNFEIVKGEITAFLGPNGAGKSTTLKILLGLRKPTEGTVRTEGRIGYTSQELSFPAHLKVQEILSFVKAHYPDSHPVEELARRFHLDHLMNRQIGGLSGGEKRRLGLACALMGKPDILVLDEPTTGLDLESRHHLWSEIQTFKSSGGSVLLSTHDLHEVSRIADRILLLDQGQILFAGSLQKILEEIDLQKVTYRLHGQEESHVVEDSDAFVRELVLKQIPFVSLQIHPATLEEAFLKFRGRS
jgi:ABC-2 type transport system ATP-binding protein